MNYIQFARMIVRAAQTAWDSAVEFPKRRQHSEIGVHHGKVSVQSEPPHMRWHYPFAFQLNIPDLCFCKLVAMIEPQLHISVSPEQENLKVLLEGQTSLGETWLWLTSGWQANLEKIRQTYFSGDKRAIMISSIIIFTNIYAKCLCKFVLVCMRHHSHHFIPIANSLLKAVPCSSGHGMAMKGLVTHQQSAPFLFDDKILPSILSQFMY